jgi:hypothetical protein
MLKGIFEAAHKISFEKKIIYETFFHKLSRGGQNSYVKRGL